MNKLKLMNTFMLIAEEGNIARAADRLGLTKAAVSKQLIDLEQAMNSQLVNRTTRTLQLTDLGQLFYESIKKIFLAVDEAETLINYSHKNPSGRLRVASHRHFGEKFIMTHMKEFLQIYPNLKFDLELTDRFPDLDKENIDILCGPSYEGPDNLIRKEVASVLHVLCASPEYLNLYGVPKTPDDLKQHRYITHSFRNPDNRLIFSDKKELYLDPYIRLNDALAMLSCGLQGLGFIKIYNYYVEDHLRKGNLIELLKEYREPKKSLYIFCQRQKYPQLKIQLFLDFISKKIALDQFNDC